MSRRESLISMFTFTSVLEAGAGAGDLSRGRLLANCVDTSFGTLDLDLIVGGAWRVVLHPFWQVCPCRIERNLNPFTSGDGEPFPAWKGA